MTSFVSSTTFEDYFYESCSFVYVGTPMYVSYSTNIQENKSYAPTKIEICWQVLLQDQLPIVMIPNLALLHNDAENGETYGNINGNK